MTRGSQRTGALLRVAVLAGVLAGLVAPETASAHERRTVVNGRYEPEVGFIDEPAVEQ